MSHVYHIHPNGTSGLHVAAADEGGIMVAFHPSVEAYHGNTPLPGTINGRAGGLRLIGSHHQQVDAHADQTVYLADLQLRVVVGTGYRHLHILLVEVLGGQHLVVYLLAPLPFSTLRYPDPIHFLV